MHLEDPVVYSSYNVFFQPLCVASILMALYGINIVAISLKQVNPGEKNFKYDNFTVHDTAI